MLPVIGTHFRIGPEAGWSYDYLSVSIPKANGGLNNKNYWESRWIGFAAQFLYEEWSSYYRIPVPLGLLGS